MERNKRIRKEKDKGITLIALVVTIIILIILATISVNMVFSENGLIATAKEAREHQLNAVASDEKDMNRLEGEYVNIIVGEIEEEEEGINAREVLKEPENYYGSIVKGYECTNSAGVNNWKIFYSDGNNIYIIADDYIHKDYCPNSATEEIKVNRKQYQLSTDNVVNDYKGSADIVDTKIQNLNKGYFEYLKTNGNIASTNSNMKAVAYMLDTKVWKDYAGKKAEYAIGGPTLEMLFNSYNQKYKTNDKYQVRVTDINGYQLSIDGGTNWITSIGSSDYLDTNDSLYVIKDETKTSGMWLASPSATYSYTIFLVPYTGKVGDTDYRYGYSGFRPIVCLDSKVKLEKQEDETYLIK